MPTAPDIYDYSECNTYLQAWLAWAKTHRKGVSLATIAAKLEIKSKSHLHKIFHDAKPPMGPRLVGRFSELLGHDEKQREFFAALVGFSRAQTREEKNNFYRIMHRLRPLRSQIRMQEQQYEYFSNPHFPVLREAVCLPGFHGNLRDLGQHLVPPLSEAKVRKALQRLVSMGLLAELPMGGYRQTEALLDTGHDIVSLAVTQFHCEMARRAAEAIATMPSEKRQVGALTFSYPSRKIERLRCLVRKFQDELIQEILAEAETADQVYQINLHCFPLLKDTAGQDTHKVHKINKE